MSSSELEAWLKEEQSTSSGWSKDDGSGETIGHDRYVYSLKPSTGKLFENSFNFDFEQWEKNCRNSEEESAERSRILR